MARTLISLLTDAKDRDFTTALDVKPNVSALVSMANEHSTALDRLLVPMTSGRYYFAPNVSAVSTSVTLTNGTLRAVPVYIPTACSIQRIGAECVTIGDVGCKYRLGVYTDDGTGRPGTLLVDAGTIAGDSATVQEITLGTPLAITTPGWYWFVGVVQLVTTTQPTMRVCNAPFMLPASDSGTALPGAAALSTFGRQMTGVAGALPGTWVDAGGVQVTGAPRIIFKIN